jgi:type III pantothenate kinase
MIDMGNTFTKIYYFDKIVKRKTNLEIIKYIKKISLSSKVYIFSVVKEYNIFFRDDHNIIIMNNQMLKSYFFIKDSYIDIMGIDRVVCCIGAQEKYSEFIVVDIGTATTFDIVSKKKYIKGFILPGEKIMKESLISNTSQINDSCDKLSPTFGQINDGIKLALFSMIKELHFMYNYPIIITGGGKEILDKKMSDWIFFDDLMCEGMKKILGELNE